jgi:hypothetical protein
VPLYNTVHNALANPVYAGTYAFGRTTSKVCIEDGRERIIRGLRRPQTEWDVLVKDQYEAYYLRSVQEEPAHDCQQCDREGKCFRERGGAQRATAAREIASS